MTDNINDLIRRRRAIFPKSYIDRDIPEEIVHQLLENARWAPTHRMTEPWRFIIFQGEGRRKLGEFMSASYLENTPTERFSDMAFQKMLLNPQRAGCVIAICMQPDPDERIPEWEEIAATACAVQNMWLTATAYGLGAYWSTPGVVVNNDAVPGLKPGERCLGIFYVAYHDMPEVEGKRSPVEKFTTWING